ncbi:hypothetical protein [Streptomyces sp. NPDC088812]|uniref:hypothetical protein n=1 Tax=Streptomyces sp. NPDC088812 TaxID=3365905 RepID=UPI0037F515B4
MADIAQGCPLVMVVDDLHEADDALLDFICAVSSEAAEGTLFIAAAARPGLFARRPGWGGGTPHFLTISIDASESAHQPLTNSRAQPAEPPVPAFVDCMP